MCTIRLTIYACMRSIEPQKQFTLHLILFCCDFYKKYRYLKGDKKLSYKKFDII